MDIIASPCIRNCCLNNDDVCLGCGREMSEICGWTSANNDQKQAIIEESIKRLQHLQAKRS
jgi:predicted Fe-S protein YdhL (DUF1289 family)